MGDTEHLDRVRCDEFVLQHVEQVLNGLELDDVGLFMLY